MGDLPATGPEPATTPPVLDRRWAVAIISAVVATIAAVLIATIALAPGQAAVPSPLAERRFIDWCHRAGGEEDRCGCAYDQLVTALGPDRLASLEERLTTGGGLPSDVAPLVSSC